MKAVFAFSVTCLFAVASCDFGLINLLFSKADQNLDHVITKTEFQTIWLHFDKNNDTQITQAEYVPYWMKLTGHSRKNAIAYFLLADLNDDDVINQTDTDALFKLFDTNSDGQLSPAEFSFRWQKIIIDMPFAVMFEHGDSNHDDYLSSKEFQEAILYLDPDHDRNIRYGEFVHVWRNKGFGTVHQASALFKHLDTTQNKAINKLDMPRLFTKFDTSKDQKITLTEFTGLSAWVPALETGRRAVRTSEIQYEIRLFDAVDLDNNTLLNPSELRSLFLLFDANHDNRVPVSEFKNEWVAVLKLGSAEQAAILFKRADSNGDGTLTPTDLPQIFAYFDTNGDKQITSGEFLTQWSALNLGPINPVIVG